MGLLRFYGIMGGGAMKSQNHSLNSVEIIAQAKAGREGVELHIWFSLSDVSAIVRLIISAVLMLNC